MTPEERREYEEEKARWEANDREFRVTVARRAERLRGRQTLRRMWQTPRMSLSSRTPHGSRG